MKEDTKTMTIEVPESIASEIFDSIFISLDLELPEKHGGEYKDNTKVVIKQEK